MRRPRRTNLYHYNIMSDVENVNEVEPIKELESMLQENPLSIHEDEEPVFVPVPVVEPVPEVPVVEVPVPEVPEVVPELPVIEVPEVPIVEPVPEVVPELPVVEPFPETVEPELEPVYTPIVESVIEAVVEAVPVVEPVPVVPKYVTRSRRPKMTFF